MSSTVKFSIGIVLFLTLGFGYSMYNRSATKNNQKIHAEVVESSNGYGYQIMLGEKIMIFQEFIPGLPGKQRFTDEDQAQKTANLVLSKLKEGKSPILLPSDLVELNISTLADY